MTVLDEVPATVLAVFAHPDDPEVACAGTLARWAAAGASCHIVIVSAGEKGSDDPATVPAELAATRAVEAQAAADVIGMASLELLGVPDGEIENTTGLRGQLVAVVRRLRPDVVIAPDPTAVFFGDRYVNHHDHRSLGWAVLDTCAPMAASPHYYPDAGPAHAVGTLLLAGTLEADSWVDIGDHLATKAAALGCHRSQLGDGVDLLDELVAARAAEAASASGDPSVRYAEGYRRLRLAT